MKKYLTILVVVMLAATISFVGCKTGTAAATTTEGAAETTAAATTTAGAAETTAAASEWSLKTAAEPYKGVTLKILGDAATEADALIKYDSEFTELTGIKVVWDQQSWDELRSKMFMDFSSGAGVYDLLWSPFDDMKSITSQGYVIPIDKFLSDPALCDPNIDVADYPEQLWKVTSWHGDPAVPYGFSCENPTMILWYRKDLIENSTEKENFKKEYGYDLQVPETVDQYYDIAEFFTRKSGEQLAGEVLDKDFYGVGIHGKRHMGAVCEWMNLSATWGDPTYGGVLDKNDNIVVNRPENVEALDYWVSLFKFAPPGCVDWYWDQLTTAFQKDIVFMAFAWNDQSYGLEDPAESEVAGKMGYAVLPMKEHKVSHFGSWSWTISAKSKNQEAAWLYMQWATSKDVSLRVAKEGGMPARKSVFADPEIAAIPFMPATGQALEYAFPRPVHRAEWSEMAEILALYLTQAHRKEITSQEALDQVAIKWQELLKTEIINPPKTQ